MSMQSTPTITYYYAKSKDVARYDEDEEDKQCGIPDDPRPTSLNFFFSSGYDTSNFPQIQLIVLCTNNYLNNKKL